MKVEIYDVYSRRTENFVGTPEQIRNQLNARYQFLQRYKNQTLQEDLERLASQQSLFVEVTE